MENEMHPDKQLKIWLEKRLARHLWIDEWQREALIKLCNSL
jgi:hypothetical protein